jgi:predicted RNA-binding Zn-ribbon protein involved in translation (DUF1610 family)
VLSFFKKLWRDQVFSKVISDRIIAIVGSLSLGAVVYWWKEFIRILGVAWNFLGDSTSVPNWLIGLLSFCALLVLLGLLVLILTTLKKTCPDFRTYNTDVIYNVRWNWQYDSYGRIRSVLPFCPACGYQITPIPEESYRVTTAVIFSCPHCGGFEEKVEESFEEIEEHIVKVIQLKLRKMHQGEPYEPPARHKPPAPYRRI